MSTTRKHGDDVGVTPARKSANLEDELEDEEAVTEPTYQICITFQDIGIISKVIESFRPAESNVAIDLQIFDNNSFFSDSKHTDDDSLSIYARDFNEVSNLMYRKFTGLAIFGMGSNKTSASMASIRAESISISSTNITKEALLSLVYQITPGDFITFVKSGNYAGKKCVLIFSNTETLKVKITDLNVWGNIRYIAGDDDKTTIPGILHMVHTLNTMYFHSVVRMSSLLFLQKISANIKCQQSYMTVFQRRQTKETQSCNYGILFSFFYPTMEIQDEYVAKNQSRDATCLYAYVDQAAEEGGDKEEGDKLMDLDADKMLETLQKKKPKPSTAAAATKLHDIEPFTWIDGYMSRLSKEARLGREDKDGAYFNRIFFRRQINCGQLANLLRPVATTLTDGIIIVIPSPNPSDEKDDVMTFPVGIVQPFPNNVATIIHMLAYMVED